MGKKTRRQRAASAGRLPKGRTAADIAAGRSPSAQARVGKVLPKGGGARKGAAEERPRRDAQGWLLACPAGPIAVCEEPADAAQDTEEVGCCTEAQAPVRVRIPEDVCGYEFYAMDERQESRPGGYLVTNRLLPWMALSILASAGR